eukprot:UN24452
MIMQWNKDEGHNNNGQRRNHDNNRWNNRGSGGGNYNNYNNRNSSNNRYGNRRSYNNSSGYNNSYKNRRYNNNSYNNKRYNNNKYNGYNNDRNTGKYGSWNNRQDRQDYPKTGGRYYKYNENYDPDVEEFEADYYDNNNYRGSRGGGRRDNRSRYRDNDRDNKNSSKTKCHHMKRKGDTEMNIILLDEMTIQNLEIIIEEVRLNTMIMMSLITTTKQPTVLLQIPDDAIIVRINDPLVSPVTAHRTTTNMEVGNQSRKVKMITITVMEPKLVDEIILAITKAVLIITEITMVADRKAEQQKQKGQGSRP